MAQKKHKIGIAFGGGGARGFAHLGVMEALLQKGIKPDVYSGVSAGSIVGAFMAAGYAPKEVLAILNDKKLTDYTQVGLPVMGLLKLDKLMDYMSEHLGDIDIADLRTPLFIGVANLTKGRSQYFNTGHLPTIVEASSSIPVLFAPVEIDGDLYVDGGVFDNIPIDPLLGYCEKIIAINVNPVENIESITNLIQVATRTFQLSVNSSLDDVRELVDLLIEPDGLESFDLLDITRSHELFDLGYYYTKNLNINI